MMVIHTASQRAPIFKNISQQFGQLRKSALFQHN